MGIKNREDYDKIQSNLNKIYKWADDKNMKFNDKKFELLKYRKRISEDSVKYYTSDG